MKHFASLRDYIEALRALGEIQEIDTEVDWNLEMGAIIQRSYELGVPAPLFNRIRGIESGIPGPGRPGRRQPKERARASRPVSRSVP